MARKTAAKPAATRKEPRRRAPAAQAPPPAYFLSLTVENVRCFGPEQTLDLSDGKGRPRQWTVLLGENGVGKTTLLECLAALEPANLPRPAGGGGPARPWIATLGPEAPSVEKYWRRGANEVRFGCKVGVGATFSSRVESETIEDWTVAARPSETGPVLTSSEMPHRHTGGPVCYAYGAARRMGLPFFLVQSGPEGRTASLFSDAPPLRDAEEWLLSADHAALFAADKRSPNLVRARTQRDQVVRILIDLLPDVRQIRVVDLSSSNSTARLGVEAETDYGWVRLDGLSLGYRAMIAWTVDVASRLFERYPDSPDPLAEPAVVLVDEIDLHMHPKWQREIKQFLTERFPNTQFIVTSHSPLMAQAAEDANIAVLRREGDHVVIDQKTEAVRGWRVDQLLTSDLFGLETARSPQLEPLLAERRTLLSKGRLTKPDRKRLAELEKEIGDLPTGETPEDIKAMAIIRRAAEELKRRGEGGDDPHQ